MKRTVNNTQTRKIMLKALIDRGYSGKDSFNLPKPKEIIGIMEGNFRLSSNGKIKLGKY